MIYGYARVSDKSQQLDAQIEELQNYGCEKIVSEVITGIAEEKKLNDLVANAAADDTIVVTRVDRLGRNALQLLQLMKELEERNISLVVMNLGMDTRTPIGQAVLAILSAFAQMERDINKEKQRKGIESAKRRGKHLGRPREYTPEGLKLALEMYDSGKYTVTEISRATQVSKASLYRAAKARPGWSMQEIERRAERLEKNPELAIPWRDVKRTKTHLDGDPGLNLEDTEESLADEYPLKRYGNLPWEEKMEK